MTTATDALLEPEADASVTVETTGVVCDCGAVTTMVVLESFGVVVSVVVPVSLLGFEPACCSHC